MVNLGILVEALFLFKAEKAIGPMQDYEKELNKLGSTLRWVGRDYMRLGSTVSKVSSFFGKYWQGLKTASLDLGGAFEDISWAFEDVADVIGSTLAPTFEWFSEIIEKLADFLETNPGFAQLLGVLLMIGVVAPRILGIFAQFFGWFKTFAGSILMTKKYNLSLWESIKVTTKGLFGLRTEAGQVSAMNSQLKKGIWGASGAMQKLDMNMKETRDSTGNLSYGFSFLTDSERETYQATDKQTKKGKRFSQWGRKGISTLAGLAFAGLGVAGVMGVMNAVLGEDTGLWEAFTSAAENVFEPLQPFFEAIGDWIEENPGQAMGIILGILGGFTGLKLLDAFAGLADLPGRLGKAETSLKSFKGAMGEVAFNAGLFLLAFVGIKALLDILFPGMDEGTKTVFALAGAIGVLAIANKVDLYGALTGAVTKLWEWIGTLVFAKTGVDLATLSCWQLAAAVGAVVGGFILGWYAATALKDALGPMGPALIVVAGAVIALAAAVWMLQSGWTMGGALIMLAASAAAVGGMVAMLSNARPPGMAKGGIVTRPTIATLGEKGPEAIVPLKGGGTGMTTEPPYSVTFNVSGAQDPKEFARKAYDELERLRKERMKGKLY